METTNNKQTETKTEEHLSEWLKMAHICALNEVAKIDNYPYGFRNRCILRAWFENAAIKQRLCTNTEYNGKINATKKSTYFDDSELLVIKDNYLYRMHLQIYKYNDDTSFYEKVNYVSVWAYAGKSEYLFKAVACSDDFIKSIFPESMLKHQEICQKMNNAITKHFNNSANERVKLFENKTEQDIKDYIKNIDNWKFKAVTTYTGMKDGFVRNYNKEIGVYLDCEFIHDTIYIKDSQDLRLTESVKQEMIKKAFEVLKFLLLDIEQRITMDFKTNETRPYPKITMQDVGFDTLIFKNMTTTFI